MAVFKCKMCGGKLEIFAEKSVATCEYCGTDQTIPSADDEKKLTLFARANRLRFDCEFDKASSVYEMIVADFPEEAEAYWGLVLCQYGIEYVDDAATGRKIPTCHRSTFGSVFDDANFELAMEYADGLAKKLYHREAKAIEELRRGILEVSQKEEPYDIFICYKELDEDGNRTTDSVLAQDVYEELTDRGHRVFFSRISLEERLGQEYEPYIFAALNSARVMLVFGTEYEYLQAVWVRNEWSRYLQRMSNEKGLHLIPCYKNLDVYELPKEFRKLQAQDLGKVGAVQDLVRGVEKLLPRAEEQKEAIPEKPKASTPIAQGGPNMEALLMRGWMAMEDAESKQAKQFFDQVLNMDARCASAYLGKGLLDFNAHSISFLRDFWCRPGHFTPESRILPAGEPNLEEETRIIRENLVPGYPKTARLRLLNFDFGYPSFVQGWEEVRANVCGKLRENKNLMRAEKFGDEKLKGELLEFRKAVDAAFVKEIEKEKRKDEAVRKERLEQYQEALRGFEVQAIHARQLDEEVREEEYQRQVRLLRTTRTARGFAWSEQQFRSKRLCGYKESDAYADQCFRRVVKLRRREKRRKLLVKLVLILLVVFAMRALVCQIMREKRASRGLSKSSAVEYCQITVAEVGEVSAVVVGPDGTVVRVESDGGGSLTSATPAR